DIRDQAPFKPRVKTFFKRRYLPRRAVARYDDLFLIIIERVERMEEFFLCPFLSGHELYVVEQQYVDRTILVSECRGLIKTYRVNQLMHEQFARDICDTRRWRMLFYRMSDRMHQVRLAKPHASVEEERIVCGSRTLGNAFCGGIREFISGADDELIESVF